MGQSQLLSGLGFGSPSILVLVGRVFFFSSLLFFFLIHDEDERGHTKMRKIGTRWDVYLERRCMDLMMTYGKEVHERGDFT